MSDADTVMLREIEGLLGLPKVLDDLARKGKNKARFFAVLERDMDFAISSIESNAQHWQDASEDALSRIIVAVLHARGHMASSDKNERGHVDILVENEAQNLKWPAEAKKHNGYDYDIEGVLQLITRYASGRYDRGGLVLYVKNKDAAGMAQKWREHLKADERCETVEIIESGGKVFTFRSVHRHSSGVDITLRHHVVLMHFDPQDKSGRGEIAT